jgi:hypothetical protein
VASVQPIGWSATAAPGPTAASYAGQLEELAAELVLWRRQEPPTGPGTRARNLLVAAYGCGPASGSPRRPCSMRRSSAAPAHHHSIQKNQRIDAYSCAM